MANNHINFTVSVSTWMRTKIQHTTHGMEKVADEDETNRTKLNKLDFWPHRVK